VTIVAAAGALLIGAGCSSLTHAQRKEKAEQHWGRVRSGVKLQMARQQFERGNTKEALRFVDEALSWDQQNPDVYLLLAECQLEDGKLAAAERAVDQAAHCAGEARPKIEAMQGLIAERRGNLEAALGFYHTARELDDSEVDYLVSEAECLVALSRAHEARELLNEQMINYSNDPSLQALLGEIALRDGDVETARASFRAVLSAGVYDPVIAEEFALLAVHAGDYGDALTVLQPLLDKQGAEKLPPSVVRAAAECMLALHRIDSAKTLLNAAVKRNADDVKAWFLLARAGIATNDAYTTGQAAKNVQRLAPNDPQGVLIDAYARVQSGEYPQAAEVLRRAAQQQDANPLVYCMLGLVAERQDDPSSARTHYRQALRVDPACRWAQQALRRIDADTSETAIGSRTPAQRDNPPARLASDRVEDPQ